MESSPLPPPTPELVALRVFTQAYWRTLKPKERLKLQAAIAEAVGELEAAPLLMRPTEDPARLASSRARGIAWVRRVMSDVLRAG